MRITKYGVELDSQHANILVKENSINYQTSEESLASPDALLCLLRDAFHLDRKAEEHIYLLALDSKYHLIGIFEVSHGIVNASVCSPREIFIRALLCGASCIALAHNHPSGDHMPSEEDRTMTKRIKEAGKLLNVPLIEHIILGENGKYFSFCEEGLIEK